MDYAAAVSWLLSAGQELRGVKFDLANVSRLLAELGHPERAWKSVHIAGTNGKGSVAAMLESVLRAAGYRTGLYTSPHLQRVNERVRVAGAEIGDAEFADVATDVRRAIERLLASGSLPHHPSFFEILTAIGFVHFRRAGCEIVVLETGMGGRLDATNVVTPLVSVITLIDFDHEAYLGRTVEAIAFEKAGIIKAGVPVVSAPQRPEAAAVLERVAKERGTDILVCDATPPGMQVPQPLPGRHQQINVAVVLGALRKLPFQVPTRAVEDGLRNVRWPGRLEWIEGRPALLLDGAHNPLGARALRAYLEEEVRGRRIVLVFGVMCDKAVEEIAEILFPAASAVVLTRPHQKRAATPAAVAEVTGHLHPEMHQRDDPAEALELARRLAGHSGVVVVTGSLYLVGELRESCVCCP